MKESRLKFSIMWLDFLYPSYFCSDRPFNLFVTSSVVFYVQSSVFCQKGECQILYALLSIKYLALLVNNVVYNAIAFGILITDNLSKMSLQQNKLASKNFLDGYILSRLYSDALIFGFYCCKLLLRTVTG